MKALGIQGTKKTHLAAIDAYIFNGREREARRYLNDFAQNTKGRLDPELLVPFAASYSRKGDVEGVQAVMKGMIGP
jgi:hypothetical protein